MKKKIRKMTEKIIIKKQIIIKIKLITMLKIQAIKNENNLSVKKKDKILIKKTIYK